jgi:hypothetical protein
MSDKKQTLLEAINALVPNDIKLAIKDLKAKFDAMPPMAEAPVAPAPTNPIEVKLKDGTSLSVDKMEVGGIANIVSETGSVLAEAKDYEAEDGTVITVGIDGVIANIKTVEVAPDMNKVTPEMLAALSARMSTLETELSASKANNLALQTQLSSVNEAQKVTLRAVESIINTPAGEPIEKPTTTLAKNHAGIGAIGNSKNK